MDGWLLLLMSDNSMMATISQNGNNRFDEPNRPKSKLPDRKTMISVLCDSAAVVVVVLWYELIFNWYLFIVEWQSIMSVGWSMYHSHTMLWRFVWWEIDAGWNICAFRSYNYSKACNSTSIMNVNSTPVIVATLSLLASANAGLHLSWDEISFINMEAEDHWRRICDAMRISL